MQAAPVLENPSTPEQRIEQVSMRQRSDILGELLKHSKV
jgi:hypothetical protein